MDLETIRQLLTPFVALFLYIVTSGVGVAAVTQLLKDRRIPVPATTYPRVTAAVFSIIATLISLYLGPVNLLLTTPWHYAGLAVVILLASALSYQILIKGLTSEKA